MSALIVDHVWRPRPNIKGRQRPACEYMNCRRPRVEHERAISGRLSRRRS